jgi:hypothetical protein
MSGRQSEHGYGRGRGRGEEIQSTVAAAPSFKPQLSGAEVAEAGAVIEVVEEAAVAP